MRYALIVKNIVINIVAADVGYVPDAGVVAVPSDTANIGDAYNSARGGSFISNAPPPLQVELISHAEAKQLSILGLGITVTVGGITEIFASTDTNGLVMLSTAILYAQMNPTVDVHWVNPGGIVSLTSAEILELGNAVFGFVQDTYAILGSVIAAVNSGAMTTYDQVDATSWPVGG